MSRRDFFQLFCMFYLRLINRKCAKEKKQQYLMLYQTWNRTPVYFKLAVSASYTYKGTLQKNNGNTWTKKWKVAKNLKCYKGGHQYFALYYCLIYITNITTITTIIMCVKLWNSWPESWSLSNYTLSPLSSSPLPASLPVDFRLLLWRERKRKRLTLL